MNEQVRKLHIRRPQLLGSQSDQEAVQCLCSGGVDQAVGQRQRQTPANQIGHGLDSAAGQGEDALELIHPAQTDQPCFGPAGARPQGGRIAALANEVGQVVVYMGLANSSIRAFLNREDREGVVAEFINETPELGSQAQGTGMGAAGIPKNVKWSHGSRPERASCARIERPRRTQATCPIMKAAQLFTASCKDSSGDAKASLSMPWRLSKVRSTLREMPSKAADRTWL